MTADLHFGCQGWNYSAWVGPFYPPRTRATDYLRVYARAFDTVEVDSTFYATPAVQTVRGWASRVPDGFTFALKLPQEITHENRLRHSESQLQRFFDVARELGPKLGPVLVQLGPDFAPAELPAAVAHPGDAILVEDGEREVLDGEELYALIESSAGITLPQRKSPPGPEVAV